MYVCKCLDIYAHVCVVRDMSHAKLYITSTLETFPDAKGCKMPQDINITYSFEELYLF